MEHELERVPIAVRMVPLNLIVIVARYRIQDALFDTRASLNICPNHTFHMMGFKVKDLSLVPMTIVGYDGN